MEFQKELLVSLLFLWDKGLKDYDFDCFININLILDNWMFKLASGSLLTGSYSFNQFVICVYMILTLNFKLLFDFFFHGIIFWNLFCHKLLNALLFIIKRWWSFPLKLHCIYFYVVNLSILSFFIQFLHLKNYIKVFIAMKITV